ncbi:hypothetical protein [Povalibacter sp.]|uniref:hypothetical protein n=1 Tax=Povalibacter sp. TaxID=1962978 RepID=UPI002F40977E
MSLAELEPLAIHQGLNTERVHVDTLSLEQFRHRVKQNLASSSDYVLIQPGALFGIGH